MTGVRAYGGWYGRLDRLLSGATLVAGGAALAFMAVLSTFNVLVMRKGLNAPIRGSEDLMVLALVTVVASAIPFGARTGAHIEIELLEPRFTKISLAMMKLVGFALVAVLAYRLWLAGGQAARFGEASQQLVISFGPFYRLLAVSAALYAAILLADLFTLLRGRPIRRLPLASDDEG